MAVQNKDLIFSGSKDCKYIIYTNAILDEEFDISRICEAGNNILNTRTGENKNATFKFRLEDKNDDLIEMLKVTIDEAKIKNLAKHLVSYLCGEAIDYNNMMGYESFKIFHVFLSKNVIEVSKEMKTEKKGTKYREGRLRNDFLECNNNSDDLLEFLKNEVFFFNKEFKHHVRKTLKLHESFGNISPKFKKLKHLSGQFNKLFEYYKHDQVIKIDQSIVGHGKLLTDGDVKNMGKLVGNLLVFDSESKMLKFANKEHLEGDVKELFNMLQSQDKQKNMELYNLRFDIRVKDFPRDSLSHDDEATVREFLTKLEIFTGQAGSKELEVIIKKELKDYYGLTADEAKQNFLKIQNEIKTIWEKTGSVEYLQNRDNFFEKIVRIGNKYKVSKPLELFTGREREMKELSEVMQASSSKITVISGLGGVGKTQLTRKYISEHSQDYDDNVIWINCDTFEDSFRRLARDKLDIITKTMEGVKLDTQSIIEKLYSFFSNRKCLFIFDNADIDKKSDTFSLLCSALRLSDNRPQILITSRIQEWESGIGVFKLNNLEPEEAEELFKKGLGIFERDDKTHDEEIKILVEKLQHFPLAIQQAVAYIREQSITGKFTIIDYLEKYEKTKKQLLNSIEFKQMLNDYNETTYTTWIITIEKIKKDENNGQLAFGLLQIMSYLASEGIQRDMFLNMANVNEDIIKSAVRLLVKYSMVDGEEYQSILNIHRLVQEVTRLHLAKSETEVSESPQLKILKKALLLFHNNLNENNVNHAMSVWKYVAEFKELIDEFSYLLPDIVSQLEISYRHKEVIRFGKLALRLLNENDSLNILKINISMVEVFSIQSEYDTAINYCEAILNTFKNNPKLENTRYRIRLKYSPYSEEEALLNTFLVVKNIGKLYQLKGEYNKALELFTGLERILKGIEEDSGISYEGVLMKKYIVGIHAELAGLKLEGYGSHSWNTILNEYRDILAILQTNNEGRYQYDIVDIKKSIADVLIQQHKLDEAFEQYKNILKEDKPDIYLDTVIKWNIIKIFLCQGNFILALEYIDNYLIQGKTLLEKDHVDILTMTNYKDDILQGIGLEYTPLHFKIIFLIDIYYLELHLNKGGDINAKALDGCTPLDIAYYKIKHRDDMLNNSEKLSALSKKEQYQIETNKNDLKKSINILQMTKNVFLNIKGKYCNPEKVKGYIKDGAAVNAKYDGQAPLHLAAGHQNAVLEKEIAKILLENGAEATQVTDNNCNTALHVAALKGRSETVDILLHHVKQQSPDLIDGFVNAKTIGGNTALHVAVRYDHKEIVESLLSNGATYEARNKKGEKPLDIAKPSSDVRGLLCLVDELFEAFQAGEEEQVGSLLEIQDPKTLESILQAKNSDEKTLVLLANASNHKGIAQLLIKSMQV